jgi:hypothetical protein
MTEQEWLTATEPQAMLDFLRSSGRASDRKLRLFAAACCRRVWHLLIDLWSQEAVQTAERFADGEATLDELRDAHVKATEAKQDADRAAYTAEAEANFSLTDEYCLILGQVIACSAVATITLPELPSPQKTAELVVAAVGYTATYVLNPEEERAAIAATLAADTDYSQGALEAWRQARGSVHWAARLGTKELAEKQEKQAQAMLLRDLFGQARRPTANECTSRTSGVLSLAQEIYDRRSFERLPELANLLQEAGCDDAELLAHLRQDPGPHVRGCWALDLVLGKA